MLDKHEFGKVQIWYFVKINPKKQYFQGKLEKDLNPRNWCGALPISVTQSIESFQRKSSNLEVAIKQGLRTKLLLSLLTPYSFDSFGLFVWPLFSSSFRANSQWVQPQVVKFPCPFPFSLPLWGGCLWAVLQSATMTCVGTGCFVAAFLSKQTVLSTLWICFNCPPKRRIVTSWCTSKSCSSSKFCFVAGKTIR